MRKRPRARSGAGRSPFTLQNGYALKEFREARRWSGTSFAEAIGVAPSTLSNYESEHRSASPEVLDRAAEILGINVEAIRREKRELAPDMPVSPAEAVA